MAETRGFEPLDDITIIGYLVGSYFKPDSVMFPIFKFTFQRTVLLNYLQQKYYTLDFKKVN